MKLEQQVTSLEISNRLKELGVKQFQSNFQWVIDEYPKKGKSYISDNGDEIEPGNDRVDAFTVAELGEILPPRVQLPFKIEDIWYWSNNEGRHPEKTEADARGKMLIYLLENNLMK